MGREAADVLATALDQWRATLRRFPSLAAAEEQALAVRMRAGGAAGEAARQRLFEANAAWAFRIATWYATAAAPLEDLAQVANIALWRCLPRYDPGEQRGARVTTFAAWYIKRDVRRWADKYTFVVKRPDWALREERRVARVEARYEAEHGREPSLHLLAAALNVSPESVGAVLEQIERRPRLVSMHQTEVHTPRMIGSGPSTITLEDLLADEDELGDPVVVAERDETSAAVAGVVAGALTPREQQVVALFYGEDRRVAGNLKAIGNVLGISRERARQLHEQALKKLRKPDSPAREALRLLYEERWGAPGTAGTDERA